MKHQIVSAIGAVVRFILLKSLQLVIPSKVVEKSYRNSVHGWSGWIEAPLVGTLAFRRDNGSLQYRW